MIDAAGKLLRMKGTARMLAVLAHSPMGESRHKALAARREANTEPAEPQVVDTLGGRMHVCWGEGAAQQ